MKALLISTFLVLFFGFGFACAIKRGNTVRAIQARIQSQKEINEAFLESRDPGARALTACLEEEMRLRRDLTPAEIKGIFIRIHGIKGGTK